MVVNGWSSICPGVAKFPLGYDERMPTHLLVRVESMRDIAFLKSGRYTTDYGIPLPDRYSEWA